MLRASAQHIIVTPLCGTHTDVPDANAPQALLVRIDRLTLLVDCGTGPHFSTEVVDAVRPHAATIDAVLLTSSELRCCGALPMVLDVLRADVPVYATIPTAKVGLMSTVTHLLDRYSTADLDEEPPVSVAQLHAVFPRIHEVQFQQAVHLSPIATAAAASKAAAGAGTTSVTMRAVPAGRTIGSCSFVLTHARDTVVIAHNAVPASIPSVAVPPHDVPRGASVLVADAASFGAQAPPEDTEQRLFRVIRDTYRRGGSVLIPTDGFAASAELLVVLQRMFDAEGLAFPLVFAAPKASMYTDRVRTMIEFVKEDVFSDEQEAAFPGVTMIDSLEALEALPAGKCVVAHTGSAFDTGFGAVLLPTFLADKMSTVVIADPGLLTTSTSGNEKIETLNELAANTSAGADSTMRIASWPHYSRRQLEGDELADFEDELAARREQAAGEAAAAAAEEVHLITDQPVFEDSDSDAEDGTLAAAPPAAETKPAAAPTTAVHPLLHLPEHMVLTDFSTTFPLFPPMKLLLPPSVTSAAALASQDDLQRIVSIYGEPLPDADIKRFRQHTAEHSYAETALSDAMLIRSARQLDSVASRVTKIDVPFVAKANVHVFDLSRRCNVNAVKALLQEHTGVRKLVFVNGTPSDSTAAVGWASTANVTKHTGNTFAPRRLEPVDVASAVYALEVKLDKTLLTQPMSQVPSEQGTWSVGWVTASVVVDMADVKAEDTLPLPQRKRNRAEGADAASDAASPVAAVDDELPTDDIADEAMAENAAAADASTSTLPLLVPANRGATGTAAGVSHEPGSVFVGDLDLPSLVGRLRASQIQVDTTNERGVVVAADAIAVRRRARDGQVALEAAACPEQFAVRAALYKRFGCVL